MDVNKTSIPVLKTLFLLLFAFQPSSRASNSLNSCDPLCHIHCMGLKTLTIDSLKSFLAPPLFKHCLSCVLFSTVIAISFDIANGEHNLCILFA